MYYGWPSLCLNVTDLERSSRFYQALGMEVLHDKCAPGKRVVLRFGGFRLGLFQGIGSNLLNFRGADVAAVHAALKERFPGLEGELERYEPDRPYDADAPGTCWLTEDPDRNAIFFDTNETETGDSFKQEMIAKILSDAEHELIEIGASEECLQALRTHLIDRFGEARHDDDRGASR